MVIAILSDVHGNLPALERFVQSTRKVADSYVCLGDVVNYGPWNDECLEVVHSLPDVVLLEGNHERLFLGTESITSEIPLVQEFYDHSIKHFSRRDLISGLPTSHNLGSFVCTHTIGDGRIYADTEVELDNNYIIGHTHHQYKIQRSGKTLANCGSIGQNRKSIDRISYGLYDLESDSLTLHEESYPFERFIEELSARGYSQRCKDYYLNKLTGVTA